MKRRHIVILKVVLVLAAVYFTPILVGAWRARPLYGDYDKGVSCMGGHEIFLHLDETKAFDHCPGHREMREIGRVKRDPTSATVYETRTGKEWYRVELRGSGDAVLIRPHRGPDTRLPQVVNPWRVWLPRLLLED